MTFIQSEGACLGAESTMLKHINYSRQRINNYDIWMQIEMRMEVCETCLPMR